MIAVRGAFRNAAAAGAVAIGRRGRRNVGDVDREALGGERTAGVGRLHGDVVAGRGLVVERSGERRVGKACGGVDRKADAGSVGQAEGDRAAMYVRAGGRVRDLDVARVQTCALPVSGAVAIGRRGRRNVGDVDREALGGERTAGVGRLHGDVVAGRGLVVE